MSAPLPPQPPKQPGTPPGPPPPPSTSVEDDALQAEARALLAAHRAAGDCKDEAPLLSAVESDMARLKPEEAGHRIGPYKLLQQIGEGGFGVVWMAEQEQPMRRRVALKIIKLGMDTKEVIARFEQERQALAMMDHPNIAKVLDAGATPFGRPFFAMELVRGVKITEYSDDQQLSTNERIELFVTVCQAVQHAHQKGIIHRDLKPSNILVTINDREAVPKVIDFGVAKATSGRLTDATLFTQFEQMVGTPLYMSPEQAEMTSLDIDTRSDIYSLGVLLYELLTGRTPIDAETMRQAGADEIRRIIREVDPPRPSARVKTLAEDELTTTAKRRHLEPAKLPAALRGDLDWIVMKCLEKDRKRRYETANGLALDLQRHLKNEVVIARPPTTGYLVGRFMRRNRLAFAAGAAIAASLVAGIGLSTWQAFVATKARGTAQAAQTEAQLKQKEAEAERQRAETEKQRADTETRNAIESQKQSRGLLYASDMNLAQQSLKQNNLGKARRLLDRHRPQPGEKDLRGWEWRHLWQQTRSNALLTLANRPSRVFSVSFSPDGTRLAVGWFDGRVELWDLPGRRQIRTLTAEGNLPPGRVAFSSIGNLLAATSDADTVSLYDLESDRKSTLWRAPDERIWDVRDLSFSPDGSKVVVYAAVTNSSSQFADHVWVVNATSSKAEADRKAIYSGDNHFGAAQLSPDNRHLYVASSDYRNYRYSIQCVDVIKGDVIWETGIERDQGLTTLAVSPDGRLLASGSGYEDPTIRVWDTSTGRLLVRLDGHTAWVAKLVFSNDGRRLVSAASDQTIRLWDTSNWTEMRVLRGHADELHAVAISHAAQLVASGSKDGELTLWKEDGRQSGRHYRLLPENTARYQAGILDESRVFFLPPGDSALVLDLKDESPMTPLPQFGFPASLLGYARPTTFFHWDQSNQILIHELHGKQWVKRRAIALSSSRRPSIFTYNGKRQLLAWTEGPSSTSIYIVSLAAPDRRIELTSDLAGASFLSFSEDGQYLLTAHSRRSVRVWMVETGRIVLSLDETGIAPIFSADGQPLIVVAHQGRSHEVRFYDLAHPDQLPRRIPGNHFASRVALSPDRRVLASPTGGGQVRLFDAVKGELIESLHGHLNAIFGVDFSADGQRLITSSGGREAVKLWDFNTRQELLTLNGHGSTMTTTKWTTDGNAILAGPPWQAWLAPSWEEIAAAEAKEQ